MTNIEFIIRNAIFKLGSKWSFTIICGNQNHSFIKEIVKNIDRNINIICLNCNNMTQQEYKLQLSALKSTLEIVLIEGDKKGKEISTAYECGMYIGTIKAVISHLEELTK